MPLRNHWAAILAGGEGLRLRPLTRLIAGDDRPKQFCRMFGGRTLLDDTRLRLTSQVEPGRTIYVVTRHHEGLYREQLSDVSPHQLVEQPVSRGTTAAIAFALLRVQAMDSSAIVGFFPADHHYRDTRAFQQTISVGYAVADLRPDRVFLVGAEADSAETEYGWIEPGIPLYHGARGASALVRSVTAFHEKPSADRARQLFERRCLFNTFVMIGQVAAFEQLISSTVPELWRASQALRGPSTDADTAAAVYASLPSSDFSTDVLQARPDRLAVLRSVNSGWTDLGQISRVEEVLARRRSSLGRQIAAS
jgi:mannose-1-phosphate guanylyltransferase